ncbi:AAA family ATPase [Actinomycetospora lemnae]|uniref:AAA family ATPase n=1 Tax=Actinomycetospora lemnae TaxID=3019891 RepID=A0ABT5SZY6_9PSEU|nr:AAA family ATPase [Actinomycetospora sp. DW7H6]MDD7968000.1 AAA family ATPase [Actinomycetospora sp. DW7H6]
MGSPGGPRSLTRREQEVLAHVTDRLTNTEIAHTLVLSRRTVESHVSSLLAKLGAADRSELVASGARMRLDGALPAPDAGPSEALPDGPSLAGRDHERDVLRRALDRAVAGRGSLVLLAGEPGIGKTRLVEEISTEAARRGALVLVGQARERGDLPPYGPVAVALERALEEGELPDDLGPVLAGTAPGVARAVPALGRAFPAVGAGPDLPLDRVRREVHLGVTTILERLARPRVVLLAIEDLHWADEATLALLEHLAERVTEIPVLVVGTHRDADADLWPRLVPFLDHLVRGRLVDRLQLAPLDQEGVAAMLRALTGLEPPPALVHQLHADTTGNPLFVRELIRFLVDEGRLVAVDGGLLDEVARGRDEVPGSLRLIIRHRLDQLDTATVRVLQVAAVLGQTFDVTVLSAVLAERTGPVTPALDEHQVVDAVEESLRAGLLVEPRGAGVRDLMEFHHALVHATLLSTLSAPRRRQWHLHVAEALARMDPDDAGGRAPEIVGHLLAAGDRADRAVLARASLEAGRSALAAAAFVDAELHLERAERLAAQGDARVHAPALEALAMVRYARGRIDEALTCWTAALDGYEAVGDEESVGRLCVALGFPLTYAARTEEALALSRRGLDALGDRPSVDRARLLARVGLISVYGGDVAAGEDALGKARELADEFGEDPALAPLHGDSAAACHATLRIADAVEAGWRGARIARRGRDDWTRADILWPLAWDLACLGRLDEAVRVGEELEVVAGRVENWAAIACERRGRAITRFFATGDLEAYAAFARDDVALLDARFGGAWTGTGYAFLGHAELLRGRWDEALQHAARGPIGTEPSLAGSCWGMEMLVRAYRGEREAVHAVLGEHRDDLPEPGQPASGGAWALLLAAVESLVVLGEPAEPAAWYPLTVEALGVARAHTTNFAPMVLLERIAGIAASAAGRHTEAEAHLRRAMHQADTTPHQVERHETRRFLAAALVARDRPGDREAAADLLARAVEGYERLGMPRHRDLARHALVGNGCG